MFDQERLNPHGVANLPHNKKQVFHIWSQYFWLNFKLKREQDIAVESMLMNQDVLVLLPTAYGKS